MKQLLVFAGLAVLIAGCASVEQPQVTQGMPQVAPLLKEKSYADMTAVEQRAVIERELLKIGAAMQKYKSANKGELPPSLTVLVKDGLLKASDLISSADPSRGSEGGVPNSYTTWGQAAETDEPGSSYLYEFSAVACGWNWKDYVAGTATPEKLDVNKDGVVSWAEVKSWQMRNGDTVQKPVGGYPASAFPVVRCYWYNYPAAYTTDASQGVVLSLAADLKTVFSSQPWWEKDFAK